MSNASGGSIAGPVWARIMSRIYQNRRMPAAWAPPGGVVSAQVDRRTGMAMDASCPGSGQPYTEYFIHSAPVRQACYPPAQYPQMAGDSLWRDEEAGAWAYQDTLGMGTVGGAGTVSGAGTVGGTGTDLEQRGVHWPELEAQRRRQAAGGAPPAPLPGSVEDPYGTTPPPPRVTGGTRRPPPVEPAPPPPAEPPVASDGQGGGDAGGSRRRPRVIGTPVGGDASSGGGSGSSGGESGTGGSPPPAPPDSSGPV